MKSNHHSKLKVVLIACVFSVTLVLAQAQKAHANPGLGYVGAGMIYITFLTTFLTGKAIVCTTVGAVKASAHTEGFGGAFGNCWNGTSTSQPTDPIEQPADPVADGLTDSVEEDEVQD